MLYLTNKTFEYLAIIKIAVHAPLNSYNWLCLPHINPGIEAILYVNPRSCDLHAGLCAFISDVKEGRAHPLSHVVHRTGRDAHPDVDVFSLESVESN